MRFNTAIAAMLLAAATAMPAFAQTPATPTTPVVPKSAAAAAAAAMPAPTAAVPATPAPAAPAITAPAAPTAKAAKPTKPTTAWTGAPVNINTATAAELDKLPKIGHVRAAAIIKGRPYKTIDDLATRKIISKDAFEAIKDKITLG